MAEKHGELDVLINNAGVFRTSETRTLDGLDLRFAVNTIAPYLLTKRLLPLFGPSARVINLSSAAQSPVDPKALAGQGRLPDMETYAQSKLALTMWSRSMALSLGDHGPVIFAVNPGSMLGTKMVKQGFGVAGNDIRKGADILVRAARQKNLRRLTDSTTTTIRVDLDHHIRMHWTRKRQKGSCASSSRCWLTRQKRASSIPN